MDDIEVKCYSGYTYAERPISFTWQGKDYQVAEVEKEWRGEEAKCFKVRTVNNKLFQLCYNEAQDKWSVTQPDKGATRC
ncbi:MAG TPA: hypothetical protein G4O19_01095 [Dehalococcoidia bacterium]|nr:hypothetical protein [Dehalococcoidia bacterium]